MTPTARTLQHLRQQGYTPDVVERWIPGANIRRDLFGVGDVLACKPDEPVLLVQCTSIGNGSTRVAKAKAEPRLRTWLASGSRYEVWEWEPGGKLPRVTPLVLGDLSGALVAVPPKRRKRRRKERGLFDNLPHQTHGDARLRAGPDDYPSPKQARQNRSGEGSGYPERSKTLENPSVLKGSQTTERIETATEPLPKVTVAGRAIRLVEGWRNCAP